MNVIDRRPGMERVEEEEHRLAASEQTKRVFQHLARELLGKMRKRPPRSIHHRGNPQEMALFLEGGLARVGIPSMMLQRHLCERIAPQDTERLLGILAIESAPLRFARNRRLPARGGGISPRP